MKKLTGFLLAILVFAVVAISFTSCEDQAGVYKPKKKIFKVYEQKEGEAECLKELWRWDGNKVSEISYFEIVFDVLINRFEYKGGKLIQIKSTNGTVADYIYDGRKIEKINYRHHSSSFLNAELLFKYDGGKISTITVCCYDEYIDIFSTIKRGFMGKLLPEEGMQVVAEKLAKSNQGDTLNLYFSYEGDNISSITIGEHIFTFSDYDTHPNIWYNFFPFNNIHHALNPMVFSKNNYRKLTIQDGSGNVATTTYSYTYYEDYPEIIRSSTVVEGVTEIKITRILYK